MGSHCETAFHGSAQFFEGRTLTKKSKSYKLSWIFLLKIMKGRFNLRITDVLVLVMVSLLFLSCSQVSSEPHVKQKERGDEGLTVEKYVNYYKEANNLLMEKYWPQFKGKKYYKVKDAYSQYLEEDKALLKEYDIDSKLDLAAFYYLHMFEIEEYRANDPDYKRYTEYSEARRTLEDYDAARMAGTKLKY